MGLIVKKRTCKLHLTSELIFNSGICILVTWVCLTFVNSRFFSISKMHYMYQFKMWSCICAKTLLHVGNTSLANAILISTFFTVAGFHLSVHKTFLLSCIQRHNGSEKDIGLMENRLFVVLFERTTVNVFPFDTNKFTL